MSTACVITCCFGIVYTGVLIPARLMNEEGDVYGYDWFRLIEITGKPTCQFQYHINNISCSINSNLPQVCLVSIFARIPCNIQPFYTSPKKHEMFIPKFIFQHLSKKLNLACSPKSVTIVFPHFVPSRSISCSYQMRKCQIYI